MCTFRAGRSGTAQSAANSCCSIASDTNRFQHYPRPVSLATGSRNLDWRPVSGNGTIYACTTLRIPGPGIDGRLPLAIATVELDEHVRIIANILDASPEERNASARA